MELTRTNKNMFDWVKVVPSVMVAEKELEDDGQDDWLIEIMKKEERLARMETRRKEWEAGYICKETWRSSWSQCPSQRMRRKSEIFWIWWWTQQCRRAR